LVEDIFFDADSVFVFCSDFSLFETLCCDIL
jgi:hypothetical protein